ncbi:MAG: hypothetical protein ACR2NR_23110 [Solirubrobacteraceae bacterium]
MSEIKQWYRNLSPGAQRGVMVLLGMEFVLIIAAERDIGRRSSAQLRGGKVFWRIAALNNFIGPLSYFRWGRRAGR